MPNDKIKRESMGNSFLEHVSYLQELESIKLLYLCIHGKQLVFHLASEVNVQQRGKAQLKGKHWPYILFSHLIFYSIIHLPIGHFSLCGFDEIISLK